ncbi:guanylate kinase [Exidia glandulosa HHB12029]|uniref:guanylate kinase n=1 Tax=Exidia glandulosa HHB12029 TaxID=1314781 RepID=A0A165EDY8_EXIGL|nr:guanylate kinase [Exidia glandulosa HHB12029]
MASADRPIVISGPSGAGKSTLIGKLQQRFPGKFAFSVSHTTRKPRAGEVDGKAYHFVSRDAFMALVHCGGFIEYTESYGNLYGTSVASVLTACSDPNIRCLVDIDSVGVKNFKERCAHLNALYMFISPPSIRLLESRLSQRGTDDDAVLRLRLQQCKQELDYARTGAYDAIVINDDLDRAFTTMLALVNGEQTSGDDIARLPPTDG